MFTPAQQRILLALAREAITSKVSGGHLPQPAEIDEAFCQLQGAFVTLTKQGSLRGCIGYPEPIYPLYQSIIHGAASAALQDPRFSPVTPAELTAIEIEISVLSVLAPTKPEAVVVGTHGLVVEKGRLRGLLLPQVPLEWGWDREEFLNYTCRKAGLPAEAWRTGASLYSFTAEVFSEAMYRVEIP